MIFSDTAPPYPTWRDRLQADYRRDETEVADDILPAASLPVDQLSRMRENARSFVEAVRAGRTSYSGIDAFMHEYDLSTQEGLVLMCLAEALLRVPDAETADRLIRDKIGTTEWETHLGHSQSIFVNASTLGLMISGRMIRPHELPENAVSSTLRRLIKRSGEPVIRTAIRQAMRIMGKQFVLGRSIEEAQDRGREGAKRGYRYSFDMLGEGARTWDDADRYMESYRNAIAVIGREARQGTTNERPGISVKLSAIHPRYEPQQRERVLKELTPRLLSLAQAAKTENIGFCVDAEEAERLELSLEVIERVYTDPSLDGWEGFGLAVQAYQKRARTVLDILSEMIERTGRRMNVRLVKGAYWDSEVKRSQELGLDGYPVFTRKAATDVSYVACARKLLDAPGAFYPQFATHNAYTVATILEMAGKNRDFEFQRLHGMGQALYEEVFENRDFGVPCRIYAPVGSHEDLLSYLVRRLLENGANSSFVNRLSDDRTPIEDILVDPATYLRDCKPKAHPGIQLPRDILLPERRNSRGLDFSDSMRLEPVARTMATNVTGDWLGQPIVSGRATRGEDRQITDPANHDRVVGTVIDADTATLDRAIDAAARAQPAWDATDPAKRADILDRAADMLEDETARFMAICVREAGKTLADGIAEVREAADFLRYYAAGAREHFAKPVRLPGPTGERNELFLHGRGVFACISPWNFPLAIFTGQVSAALAAGNSVVAKPAEQTPIVATEMVRLMHKAGIPADVLHLVPGTGEAVGAPLVRDPRIDGVTFTGSLDTARAINRTLAQRDGEIVPLIAETGGQNAMIVDSTALPEQAVADIVQSAFGSAGQRCSALRVLFLQSDVKDKVLTMLKGAMAELSVGDPAWLSTDIGPVIDADAHAMLQGHAARMAREGREISRARLGDTARNGYFFAPAAFEIDRIDQLEREIFGPILHVVSYEANRLDAVIDAINAMRYGLTLGIHTRIDEKADYIARRMRVGNTYINRNMVGAVVGVQPFGGERLSGTGPKAGGPHYLPRFAAERTVTNNLTASGGNASLLSLGDEGG